MRLLPSTCARKTCACKHEQRHTLMRASCAHACASEHLCSQACVTAYAHVSIMCTCVLFRAHVRASMCITAYTHVCTCGFMCTCVRFRAHVRARKSSCAHACASEHMCAQACVTAYTHMSTCDFMCTCRCYRANSRARMSKLRPSNLTLLAGRRARMHSTSCTKHA